ncbi:hypothetical protein BCD67_17655 [Oscillatoriales cyanobacterium USR001]|nr:hypothetical protein BCD67_17655 [Oscillatoriales cyanobacterium USR001]
MAREKFDQSGKSRTSDNQSTNPQRHLGVGDSAGSPTLVGKAIAYRGTSNSWGWQLMLLGFLLAFGTTGIFALIWLLAVQPPPSCQQLSPMAADGERLYCAQQTAKSGKLEQILEALALVESWPPEHPLHEQSLKLTEEWSKAILELATAKVEVGDLQGALDIIAKIPKSSPVASEVETVILGWKNNWAEGQTLYEKAQEALKAEDLKKASEYAQALFKLDNIFWGVKRFNQLVDQIGLERQGWQRLEEAKALAQEGGVEKLGEAIALAGKIGKKVYARSKADVAITRWSRELLDVATKRLAAYDLDGAIAIGNLIGPDSSLYEEAQDLMQLGRARAVTWNQSMATPLPQHIFALLEGQAAAAKIEADRPLYDQARAQVEALQVQFQDLLRLQMASTIASFGQPLLFGLAIEQAQAIGQNQPRRVHAQTLIAFWRKEISRIEDQPYILMAKQLAGPGTVEGLRAAIAQASLVAPGRPLWSEAQSSIALWTKNLQILEDEPLLKGAKALAKLGKIPEAIAKASQIKSGRVLYVEAQSSISQWVAEQQIAQDRPLLNQASELAAQGSLGAAITMAAQIGSGRALYSEAQDAIARWSAQINAISVPPPLAEPAVQYTEPARQPESYAQPAPQPESYAPPTLEPYTPPAAKPEPYTPPAAQPEPEPYTPPAPQPEPAPPTQEVPANVEPPPPSETTPAAPDANLLPE